MTTYDYDETSAFLAEGSVAAPATWTSESTIGLRGTRWPNGVTVDGTGVAGRDRGSAQRNWEIVLTPIKPFITVELGHGAAGQVGFRS